MANPGIDTQRKWWDEWIATYRDEKIGDVSEDQAVLILRWLAEEQHRLGRPLDAIDVGCGSGWLCARMLQFGQVTGTDLAPGAIERARGRTPRATFIAGDFQSLDLGLDAYDVVVTCEVLSHVSDQPAFMSKLASVLRPGGMAVIANQHRWVLERNHGISPVGEGQIRNWTNKSDLRRLMRPHFRITDLTTLTPKGHMGVLRAVNSVKVNRLLSAVVGEPTLKRLKERAGLGWTVIARGTKRS